MLRLWVVLLLSSYPGFSLSAATEGSAIRLPVATGRVSVSLEYKEIASENPAIRIFVKEKKPWIAEYFLIVNETPEVDGLSLLGDNENRFRTLGSDEQTLAGRQFKIRFGKYNLVQLKGGGYLDEINKSKYSAPVCGIARQYKSVDVDSDLKIDFINAVSCGELSLETSRQNYIKTFWERVKSFDQELVKAFVVVN